MTHDIAHLSYYEKSGHLSKLFLTTAGRIRYELQEMERLVARTTRIWQHATTSPDAYWVDATALNLYCFYAAVERLLEFIADEIDQVKPRHADWQRVLLRQMTSEILKVRPPVLSTDLSAKLDRYRTFQLVIPSVYTFDLDSAQIDVLVQQLTPTMNQLTHELRTFAEYLERVAVGG
jgi:hypothetical protein